MPDKPLTVEVVKGTLPPGFLSHPDEMWVKVTGGTPDERYAAVERGREAAAGGPPESR